jgi:hypothetical protein
MATLAILFSRRIIRCTYRRRQSGLHRAAELCCFHQQKTQQCIALLADVPQPLPAGAGVFARNQPGLAANLLAARKPIRSQNDKNVSQPVIGRTPGRVINRRTSGCCRYADSRKSIFPHQSQHRERRFS